MINLFQELLTSKPDNKNWKGLIIAVVCIIFILATVTLSVVVLSPEHMDSKISGKR